MTRAIAAILALSVGCATARQPADLVVRAAPYPDLPPLPEAAEVEKPDPGSCADPTPIKVGREAPCSGLIFGPQDAADFSASHGSIGDVRAQLERLRLDAVAANGRCELAQELLAARLLEAERQQRQELWRGVAMGAGLGIVIGAAVVGLAVLGGQ